MDSTAILITGAPGSGKSSVLERLATLLERDGVSFGALESEQLGWGSPSLGEGPWLAQLAAVMQLQRAAGRRLFLIAATTETTRQLNAVVAAIGADRQISVLLEAGADVVARRVADREPDLWPGKRRLIAHARLLATQMSALDGIDIRLRTEDADVTDVARQLHASLTQLNAW